MYLFLAAAFAASPQALLAEGPAPVNLGSTAQFAILSETGITTAGQTCTVSGNVGTSPAAGSYEINMGESTVTVNGIIYQVNNSGGPAGAVNASTLLTATVNDMVTAYNDAAGRTPIPTGAFLNPGAGAGIGGLNLVPGLYKFTSSLLVIGSNLTLTGGPNDVWIFQVVSDLQVANGVQIILAGGAQAGNVFWQVGSGASIGSSAQFQGTILAGTAITMNSTSTMVGRALAQSAVTFGGTSITLPATVASAEAQASLQVNIAPSAAASAGAQWQVEYGTNHNSGATVTNLAAGTYIVSFTTIAGWNTPAEQTVILSNGVTTEIGGLYIPSVTPTSGLILLTNGDGIIRHAAWPDSLVIGNTYEVTAVAAGKNIFSNWVGGTTQPYTVLGASARYTFIMQSNLLLEANFVTNPFIAATGIYNGLFSLTNGVTEQTAGMLRDLIVRENGTYSGEILVNGQAHAIGGSFDLSGQATNQVRRSDIAGGAFTVELMLNWNESPLQVTGTVSGNYNGVPWTATNLIADLATNNMLGSQYTMLLPPDTNNAPPDLSPGGDGYALITNNSTMVKITGALADGTAFNQAVPVSQDGFVPIYVSLYAGKGLLLGWINLELTNTNAIAASSLTWIHPARASGLYRNGFTNVLLTNQILLSPWIDPPANLALLTSLSTLATINATNALESYPVTIHNNNTISGAAPVTGSVNPHTGFLRVVIGAGADRVIGYGAVLPNATNGGGYYLTATNAQAVKIAP